LAVWSEIEDLESVAIPSENGLHPMLDAKVEQLGAIGGDTS